MPPVDLKARLEAREWARDLEAYANAGDGTRLSADECRELAALLVGEEPPAPKRCRIVLDCDDSDPDVIEHGYHTEFDPDGPFVRFQDLGVGEEPPADQVCNFIQNATCPGRWPDDQMKWCARCLLQHMKEVYARVGAEPSPEKAKETK